MNAESIQVPSLSFDRLRRIQTTLSRRGQVRDGHNIRAVGFAPAAAEPLSIPSGSSFPITAQFDVFRKLNQVPAAKRIERIQQVRLLDRPARRYLQLELVTDIVPTGEIVPTGVRVEAASESATTSAVVRWTKVFPVPALPTANDPEDPRWRWGVVSVAHLFGSSVDPRSTRARIERNATCGQGPTTIEGRVVARGRTAADPDVSLIETGLDRLWLSGLLNRPDAPTILSADEPQLLQWISRGTSGTFLGDGVQHAWQWQTYYPELAIEQLGKLQHVIRYEATDEVSTSAPFGPGSSGGVLLAGGIPVGVQVAAIRPDYRVGFAQSFQAILAWLRKQLRATELQLVSLLTEA